MIVAAGLLVLVGLGLFVAGLLTEVTAFYWACVAACVVAAVVLYLARRRMTTPAPVAAAPVGATGNPAGDVGGAGRHAGAAGTAGATAASTSTTVATPAPAEQVAPAAAAAAESSAAVSGPPAAVPDPTPPVAAPATATTGAARSSSPTLGEAGEPPVEEVEVTDLLLVVDLKDEVLVIDEHPRYHVEGCRHLTGSETIPIPMDEARTDGFTPCGTCRPDATLAERVRSRKQ